MKRWIAEEALLQQPEMPDFHKPATGSGGSIIGLLEVGTLKVERSLQVDFLFAKHPWLRKEAIQTRKQMNA
eukprot:1755995-Amphidinium_carterae.1